MKHRLYISAGLVLSCWTMVAAEPPVRRAQYVIVVGVDGLGGAWVQAADAPNLDRMMVEGAWTLTARGVLPTSSSSNWGSMLTGVSVEQHGITSNGWETNNFAIPPRIVGPYGMFPTIFALLREQLPAATLATIYDWGGFGRLLERPLADHAVNVVGAANTMNAAISYVIAEQPDFLFIHLDDVDHAGHDHGWGSPQYYAAINGIDTAVGQLLAALENNDLAEETVVLLTSDHGGSGTGHGGTTVQEIEVPFLVWGAGVAANRVIPVPANNMDIAPTAAWLLGVELPAYFQGRPVASAFADFTNLPPQIVAEPDDVIVVAGGNAELSFSYASESPATVRWWHDGVELPGVSTTNLFFSPAFASDAGQYRARVVNAHGEAFTRITSVQVVSDIPTLANDLVLHLTFDQTLADASGLNHHATLVGAAAITTGHIGSGSLSYQTAANGSSFGYATLGAPALLQFGQATDFTVSFWGRLSTWTGDLPFVSNKDWNSGANQGWVIAPEGDGRLQWNLAGAPGTRKDYDGPGGTFSDGAWHHVLVSFDRDGSAQTFVDGLLVSSVPLTASANDISTPSNRATNVGQDGTGQYTWNGQASATDARIDDLLIWRRSLGAEEAALIYFKGRSGLAATEPLSAVQALKLRRQGDGLQLEWTSGQPQGAPAPTGGWTNLPTVGNSLPVSPSEPAQFYRLQPAASALEP